MPLRDHFHPPLDDETSWDGLFGQWPPAIVARLNRALPAHYMASRRIRLAGSSDADAAVLEQDEYEVRVFGARPGRRLVAAVKVNYCSRDLE